MAQTVHLHNGATSTLTKPALYTRMTGKLVNRSSYTHKRKAMQMSVQMENGTVLDADQVNALVALIKLGVSNITIEMIERAVYEIEVGYTPLSDCF
jgi:hypothetical protein